MEILIKASQLILSLSILVVLHELGHFIPAKLFKTRVEKFYLFFDPWFSLLKIKKGDTEYGVGWLPLGGYVKISGMIDESMDKEQLKKPAEAWEFRSKPAWQRLIIMIGGVTVNVVLGILIYIFILLNWGEEYLPTKNVTYGIQCDSVALEMGLRNGDKILSVDNKPVDIFTKIPSEIIFNQARTVQVERQGEKVDVVIPAGFIAKLIKTQSPFIFPRLPFVVADFAETSPAKTAGIKKEDKLIGINQARVEFFDEFKSELQKYKNKQAEVIVLRNSDTVKIPVNVPETGLIGVAPYGPDKFLEFEKKGYGFFEAIPAGTKKAYTTFDNYIKQFKLIFNKDVKGYESLGGFITIGKIFSPEWDWLHFWNLTAFLSIILAFMNILPIPALDGGHVMFLLYEVITRRKPNEKFMEYAQIAGMVLLLALMLFANGNDIFKLIKQ